MTDQDLIKNIKGLNQIKPNQEWVFLSKNRIMGEDANMASAKDGMAYRLVDYLKFLTYKPVLATVAFFGLLIGTFAMANNALPGDLLFPVKRIVEKTQGLFVSKDKLAKYQLDETQKRLDDLAKIAQQNQTKKIASGMDALKVSLSQTAKNIKSGKLTKDTLDEAKKLTEKKAEVEKALGVVVSDDEELDNAIKDLVSREIQDLEKRAMTEDQTILLNSAKQSFESGDYNKALENVWLISNQISQSYTGAQEAPQDGVQK